MRHSFPRALTILVLTTAPFTSGCRKVPLTRVSTSFSLAQSTWFESEETLFLFYRVSTEQGMSPQSVVEVRYETDDGPVDWAPVESIANVHAHLAVTCDGLCGSLSPRVKKEPRNVRFRLRYHRAGEIAHEEDARHYVVHTGSAHKARSFLVYGIFDGSNTRVQWRGRHQFPALRNEEAQALGLRRRFQLEGRSFGSLAIPHDPTNIYFYDFAAACPADFSDAETAPLEVEGARAAFERDALPPEAVTASAVCATSSVMDGKGEFRAVAVARKNPEVRPAFTAVRSPIRPGRAVPILLAPCAAPISQPHLAMQRQRLSLGETPDLCTDAFTAESFTTALAALFQSRLDAARSEERDMVLVVGLHHDDPSGALADKVEDALAAVLPAERAKASPRATGAFVFDSFSRALGRSDIKSLVLWCPAFLPRDERGLPTGTPDTSQMSCPILPDTPSLRLGPFRFSQIPILPPREQFLDFLETYSEAQAGRMKSLTFLAPERSAISTDISLGEFGWVTFFNNERITLAEGEALSYCPDESAASSRFVVRTTQAPENPIPLATLPGIHAAAPQSSYEIGLVWEFPFLLRLSYETSIAGAVSAFSATVPFGMKRTGSEAYGSEAWARGEFPLGSALAQCTRFCQHPAFDSAGVYNAAEPWVSAHTTRCYRPRFPRPDEGGFPHDP